MVVPGGPTEFHGTKRYNFKKAGGEARAHGPHLGGGGREAMQTALMWRVLLGRRERGAREGRLVGRERGGRVGERGRGRRRERKRRRDGEGGKKRCRCYPVRREEERKREQEEEERKWAGSL